MPIANKKNTPKSQKRVKVTSQCFIQNKRLLTRYTQPLTNEEAA